MKPLNVENLPDRTTKQQLAQFFGISIRSIYSYHAIAKEVLPEYLEDYPRTSGEPITRYPLTRFQCWILGKVAWSLRLLSVKELKWFLTEDYDFASKFTKEEFERLHLLRTLTTVVAEYE